MAILHSKINTRDAMFIENERAMQDVLTDLQEKLEQIKQGGGKSYQERHIARGKLLARDRIARLLDAGSPFLEIGQFAAWDVYDDYVPAAGVLPALARVGRHRCIDYC